MKDIKLTSLVQTSGCAAKIGPDVLSRTLSGLPHPLCERLLVGYDASDDAAVWQQSEDMALVSTVDFFPPMVDDPYLFGQIAAANALSDVYAMNGEVAFAVNLLCFPSCLPEEVMGEILRGGADKVDEAGGVIAGGHTIADPIPKYGLCVTGFVHPKKLVRNSGALPGDVLVLTKPLGVGILNTAAKGGILSAEGQKAAADTMTALNKYAKEALRPFSPHAMTDVTGFGLCGHAAEMANAGGVTLRLAADGPALLPETKELAALGVLPEGMYRNQQYLAPQMNTANAAPLMIDILCDPQTSGGLLVALAPAEAEAYLKAAAPFCPGARIVGSVEQRGPFSLILE